MCRPGRATTRPTTSCRASPSRSSTPDVTTSDVEGMGGTRAGASSGARAGGSFLPEFLVGALATWRVAHLVAKEDGPFDVVLRLRKRAGDSVLGRLMDCPLCVSVWAALPFAGWAVRRSQRPSVDAVPLWLAMSAGSCLLELAASLWPPEP